MNQRKALFDWTQCKVARQTSGNSMSRTKPRAKEMRGENATYRYLIQLWEIGEANLLTAAWLG
jgi:hypothetical protein